MGKQLSDRKLNSERMDFSQELRTLATLADLVKTEVTEDGSSAACSCKLWLITSPGVDVGVT